MVGLWFVAGAAVLSVLLAKYVRPTLAVSWIAYGATLAGVILLVNGSRARSWPQSVSADMVSC
jgi:hypothetical protein